MTDAPDLTMSDFLGRAKDGRRIAYVRKGALTYRFFDDTPRAAKLRAEIFLNERTAAFLKSEAAKYARVAGRKRQALERLKAKEGGASHDR